MTKITGITILVAEDDASIRFGLEEVLKSEGFHVISCAHGGEALDLIARHQPGMILLDVMMPGMSGYEIARKARDAGHRQPILMLTAKGQEMDKVVGLNAGADDYVTKPFGLNELLARIQAQLRRHQQLNAPALGQPDATTNRTAPAPFHVGEATICPETYEVTLDGTTASLTAREMELLLFLDRHRGKVLSRDHILEEVWGMRYFGTTRTLDQCIAQIRKKVGDGGRDPRHLQTVHGVGYKLV